jgi:ferritin heavy chain
VFEPFEEVKKEMDLVPSGQQLSLARHLYSPECEAAVNAQIKYVFPSWIETF